MRYRLLIFMIVLFFPTTVFAGAKVYVFATANDIVGSQLVYKIKENLRSSQGLELALSEENSAFQIRIVTLDPADSGYQTVYSVVWTATQLGSSAKIYWNQVVGICGQYRINAVAAQLIAQTDQMVTDIQSILLNLLKSKSK